MTGRGPAPASAWRGETGSVYSGPAFARAAQSFATFEGKVFASTRYSMPASVVLETTNRKSGLRATSSTAGHSERAFSTPFTHVISRNSSTGLPSATPRRTVW